jgi:hypothetical protein
MTTHEMKPSDLLEYTTKNAKYLKAKINDNFNYSELSGFLSPHKTKVGYHLLTQLDPFAILSSNKEDGEQLQT